MKKILLVSLLLAAHCYGADTPPAERVPDINDIVPDHDDNVIEEISIAFGKEIEKYRVSTSRAVTFIEKVDKGDDSDDESDSDETQADKLIAVAKLLQSVRSIPKSIPSYSVRADVTGPTVRDKLIPDQNAYSTKLLNGEDVVKLADAEENLRRIEQFRQTVSSKKTRRGGLSAGTSTRARTVTPTDELQ